MILRLLPFRYLLTSSRPYALYTLLILMIVYLLNQLDRFVLGIAGRSMVKDLQFGRKSCYLNTDYVDNSTNATSKCVTMCNGFHTEAECLLEEMCVWDFSATGIEYEVLAGPAFTFIFTLVALPLGLLAGSPRVNRRVAIALCLSLWSSMTLLSSFTHAYWQLLLTRVGLGVFEAICTPFASSIISDLFKEQYRATALGFYNWGIYIGYSLAFAFNFILLATGWRWAFRVAALPGFLITLVMLLTVREPLRSHVPMSRTSDGVSFFSEVWTSLLNPSLLLLSVAGGVRQGAGLVWAYNVKAYFTGYYCSSMDIGIYLSWIPLVGGTLGAVLGGLLSDRLVRKRGRATRLWVLICSQLLAVPFLVGAVLLPPDPWAFLCLLPAYAVGEVWIGVCLALVIEMVPRRLVAVAVAFFLFVINNIGGVLPLLIPLLDSRLELRYTLLLLFPGCYLLAAILFAVVLVVQPFCKCYSDHVSRTSLPSSPGLDVLEPEKDFLIQEVDDTDNEELLESQESLVIIPKKGGVIKVRHLADS